MKLGDAFLHYTDVSLSLLGLVLFMLVFFGSILWTGISVNKRKYLVIASNILKDDSEKQRGGQR